jgi:hypothetical protein
VALATILKGKRARELPWEKGLNCLGGVTQQQGGETLTETCVGLGVFIDLGFILSTAGRC